MVVTQDQDTQPTLPFPMPVIDVLPEDTAVAGNSLLPLLHHSPTPSPSTPPFETSLSFGRIDGFLKDICELYIPWDLVSCLIAIYCVSPTVGSPVRQFSRLAPTFEAYDTHDLVSSSSLNGLKIVEDLPWLMDQNAPPSPIESPSRSPISPFEEVISRVRARKAVAAAQRDQVTGLTRDPEIVSTGRLETSMSLGRIADFLCNICAYFGLLTLVHS